MTKIRNMKTQITEMKINMAYVTIIRTYMEQVTST